ncbi:MAG: sigma-70 family RNA polymerase sigma factor [Bacteroidetes bacterium]|nr:sigma-70 family RNA polymerase sigma factor [Bacteroidota bacterium]
MYQIPERLPLFIGSMMNRTYETYISEIKNQILDPDEEKRLIRVYQSKQEGWEDAQDKVIRSNLMYVVKVAFEYTSDPIKICDLISEGNMALLDYIDKYNPDLGTKLITYANLEIRSRMIKFITKNNYFSQFKISSITRYHANKVKKFYDEYFFIHGVKPSSELVQKEFNLDAHNAEMYLEMAESKIVSLDCTLETESGKKNAEILDEKAPNPANTLNEKQISDIILKIISTLPLRERAVINKRFGLNGEQETDLSTIGVEFNLTKERIRQIEFNVLKTIRKEMDKLKVTNK